MPGKQGQDPKAAFGKTEENNQQEQMVEAEIASTEEVEETEKEFFLSDDPAERLAQVADFLAERYEDAPTAVQLTQWKAQHNDIFVITIAEKTYIYRYLKRLEWMRMQTEEQFIKMSPMETEEYVFDKCLLYPHISPLDKPKLPAGLISTLSDQIRLNSMFLNPEALAQMTIKL